LAGRAEAREADLQRKAQSGQEERRASLIQGERQVHHRPLRQVRAVCGRMKVVS
jgi:hypothetical protein